MELEEVKKYKTAWEVGGNEKIGDISNQGFVV